MSDPAGHTSVLNHAPPDLFATTRWTVIVAAGDRATPDAEQALQELCRTYWYPLYAYVRRQGKTREDAEDLTQAFFASLLQRNDLESVGSEKGRFRAYLLAAMKHFLANDRDKSRAQKRGGGEAVHLPLDWQTADSLYAMSAPLELSPDRLFDRSWALALLEQVLTRLRQESDEAGDAAEFDRLKDFLTLESGGVPYETVGAAMGTTAGAARVAVHRLRKRYREVLRYEIAQTLDDPSRVDEEMRTLFEAFRA